MEEEINNDNQSEIRYGLKMEQVPLAREVWNKYKGEFSPKYIFLNYMKDFYEVPIDGKLVTNKAWINFVRLIKDWKSEDEGYIADISAENLSTEEVADINEENSKKLVLLLRGTINKYEKNPEQFKKLSFGDISKLYQIIQQINNATERLEIQRSKLKLEATKVFLPYTRMTLPQLIESRDSIIKGMNQLIEKYEKELSASTSREGGELSKE